MKTFFSVMWHPLRYLLQRTWFRRFAPVWLVAVLLLWAFSIEGLNRVGLPGVATAINDLIVVRVICFVVQSLLDQFPDDPVVYTGYHHRSIFDSSGTPKQTLYMNSDGIVTGSTMAFGAHAPSTSIVIS